MGQARKSVTLYKATYVIVKFLSLMLTNMSLFIINLQVKYHKTELINVSMVMMLVNKAPSIQANSHALTTAFG